MSELYYQKVVSSSSDGKLEVFDQEVLEEYLQGLFKMPKTLERMAELIEFGQRCISKSCECKSCECKSCECSDGKDVREYRNRMDALALRVFENAFHSLGLLPCDDGRKLEFAKLVREGFGYLYHSECEFVWEETGELLRACEELIGKLIEGATSLEGQKA